MFMDPAYLFCKFRIFSGKHFGIAAAFFLQKGVGFRMVLFKVCIFPGTVFHNPADGIGIFFCKLLFQMKMSCNDFLIN